LHSRLEQVLALRNHIKRKKLQVDEEGKSWRSGALVEKKLMRQWYFKLTEYAEPLLSGLETLPGWPDRVKRLQQDWIGKSKGALIRFKVIGSVRSPLLLIHQTIILL